MIKKELEQYMMKYAETVLQIGVNLQKEQILVIEAKLEAAPFVRMVTQLAYQLGASQVIHEWTDDELSLIRHRYASEESLGYYPQWKADGYKQYAQNNAAFIFIDTPNPDLLKDIPTERIAKEMRGRAAIRKTYLKYTHNDNASWVIISVPSEAWAARVFPELNQQEAVIQLWEKILQAARIDLQDPVGNWTKHLENLQKRTKQLNQMQIHTLHYRSPGTDLVIELPEKHVWLSGLSNNLMGTPFVANMPTEEVYTMPVKHGVNGTVRSSRPLVYGGCLIDNFSLVFRDGKVVDFQAETGEGILTSILDTDEGSRYLGEVALVAHHTPISMMNRNFYNILFDENASCHLAIGQSFSSNLLDGNQLSPQELFERGANTSLTHIDFMIGTGELDIDATLKDGRVVPLFRQGNWVES